jgi:hypothetical protein
MAVPMEFIKTVFINHKLDQQHKGSHTHGKAEQVQDGENFVSGNLAEKRNQVGGEHLKHGAGYLCNAKIVIFGQVI